VERNSFPFFLALSALFALVLTGALILVHRGGSRQVKSVAPPPTIPFTYAAERHRLRNANVRRDLAQALRAGDRRFLGIQSFGVQVPGVPDYLQRYGGIYEVRILKNTNEHTKNRYHADLLIATREYAEEYNRLLQKSINR
jgi:hypothetical protein